MATHMQCAADTACRLAMKYFSNLDTKIITIYMLNFCQEESWEVWNIGHCQCCTLCVVIFFYISIHNFNILTLDHCIMLTMCCYFNMYVCIYVCVSLYISLSLCVYISLAGIKLAYLCLFLMYYLHLGLAWSKVWNKSPLSISEFDFLQNKMGAERAKYVLC